MEDGPPERGIYEIFFRSVPCAFHRAARGGGAVLRRTGLPLSHRSIFHDAGLPQLLRESISLTGWLVRDEVPLQGSARCSKCCAKGERPRRARRSSPSIPTPARSTPSAEFGEQELQLKQLQFALSPIDSDAALKLDSSITDSILTLRGELADGDYSTASENVSALKAAILKRSHSHSSSEEIQSGIDQVKSELSRLRASLSGAVSVRAEKPGIYSAACDGYEDVLTPDTLADLTVSRLENLTAGSKGSSLGKLIYGDTWYYAAAVTNEQAAQLRRGRASRFALPRDWMPTCPRRFTPSGRTRAGGSCWFCVATAICRRRPSCAISR